jgi:ubiquinone/menaquinone biosynthesis C-methylase UbiE
MRTVQDRWAAGRLLATVFDVANEHRATAWLGARALWGLDVAVLERQVAHLRTLEPGTRVLDLPTGGGYALDGLRPDHGLDYVAADLSPAMLERTAKKARRLGLGGIELVEADATATPFSDDRFDVVLSLTGLHCFADPQGALREFRRVLRPGGELRLTTVVRGQGHRHDDAVRVLRALGIFGRVGTAEELSGWLAGTGFTVRSLELEGALAVVAAA